MQLCRHLRWKTFSRGNSCPAEVQASLLHSQVPFSCGQTHQAWGPDDDIAAPECCTQARECFRRDAMSDG